MQQTTGGTAATIQMIPLELLQPSTLNARTSGGQDVESLVASIRADGLLQNLTVTPSKKGAFEVVAGGRRLRALQILAKAGELADTHIPCRVVDVSVAMDASTAENTIREQMHPADEVVAYARLHHQGRSIEDIAVRFGQTNRHVERMLKLAGLSPSLLDGWREGKLTLGMAQALALTDDHARQEEVFEKHGDIHWDEDGDALRDALTDGDIPGKSRLAKYVGVDAYAAAGGAIRRDLFDADDDAVYLVDRALAEKLAMEKLEKAAAAQRKKGWLWVEPVLELPYGRTCKVRRVYGTVSPEEKAIAGVFVLPGNGRAEIEGPYIRLEDEKRAALAKERGVDLDEVAKEQAASAAAYNDILTRTQTERLYGWRTAILRMKCAQNPDFTVRALVADLAADLVVERWEVEPVLRASIGKNHEGATDRTITDGLHEAHAAGVTTEDARQFWIDRLEPVKDDILGWLLEQPMQTTLDLLAVVAAEGIWSTGEHEEREAEFMRRAGFVGKDLWRPTAEWLGTLNRLTILNILRPFTDEATLGACASLKKKELVLKSTEILAETDYVPGPLRPAGFDAEWIEAP